MKDISRPNQQQSRKRSNEMVYLSNSKAENPGVRHCQVWRAVVNIVCARPSVLRIRRPIALVIMKNLVVTRLVELNPALANVRFGLHDTFNF